MRSIERQLREDFSMASLSVNEMVITDLDAAILNQVMQRAFPGLAWDRRVNLTLELMKANNRDHEFMRLRMIGAPQSRTIGRWHVTVRPHRDPINRNNHGYFENNMTGAGGGLWFSGHRLIDYDGVCELPSTVKTILADLGFILDEYTR